MCITLKGKLGSKREDLKVIFTQSQKYCGSREDHEELTWRIKLGTQTK